MCVRFSEIRRMGTVFTVALLATAGCATVPRPVPPADQLLVNREAAGVRLSVPRVEYNAYPDHVLDAATAVFVVIENNSDAELSIEREDFTLGVPGGLRQQPLVPRQIMAQQPGPGASPGIGPAVPGPAPPAAAPAAQLVLLAGPVQAVTALTKPPLAIGAAGPRPPAVGGSPVYVAPPHSNPVVPAPPVYRTPALGFGGSLGYYYPGGDPLLWGAYPYPYYGGWDPGLDASLYWGGMPYYYPHPRQSIIRMALQNGVLPKGARAAGFLYFSTISGSRRGLPLELRWEVRDAPGRAQRAQLVVPLELDAK